MEKASRETISDRFKEGFRTEPTAHLSGLRPGKKAPWDFVLVTGATSKLGCVSCPPTEPSAHLLGLRPGEKLYEELLTNEENTTETHHPQILIAKVRKYDFEEISTEINALTNLFEEQNNDSIVQKMKTIVPEFRSNNSEYEKLDH